MNQCSKIVAKQRQHFPRVRAVLKGYEVYEDSYFMLLVNVSVGTPPQHFRLQLDVFRFHRLILLNYEDGSNYDVESDHYWRAGNRFEYSDSGTFTLFPRGFNDVFGTGRYGSDVVQLNNFVAEIKFAILEEADNDFTKETFVDGYLGLAPPYALGHRGFVEDDNIPALLQQLAHWLEKPIISISAIPNITSAFKSIDITLGGLDTDHCQNNWRFSPQTGPGYTVRASHFMIQKGNTSESIEIDTNVLVEDVQDYLLPVTMANFVFPLLGNVTKSWMGWIVIDDCDLSKHPNLTFSIGSKELVNTWKFNLTLTPADYIFYGSLSRTNEIIHCYLLLRNSTYETVIMPIQFFSRHCLAYDIKHHLVGFADRKL